MSDFAARLTFANQKTVEFHGPADITKETTEAIVNAANSSLLGGGGVDGAIHDAGGPSILAECRRIVEKIGTLPAGKAVITTGGRMPAKFVIHTVGPIYRSVPQVRARSMGVSPGAARTEPETLASCYRESIRLADDHAIRTLAFPSISTGAYGYPVHEAAEIAVRTVLQHLPPCVQLHHVRFVLFDLATCAAYIRAAENIFRELPANSAIFEKRS
ncbi:MAG: O-acetyl-ADP-ribose deacetylase [Terriglobales bacterium]|jgi:O-acetyl-ADP-ribose deacetylase (regulator of RNase III)